MQPPCGLDAKKRPLDLIVAEDYSDLRVLWELHVERWELPVRLTLVEEGFGAILAMAESAPDLVITDLSTPGVSVNGRALIEIMARCQPYDRIPIIVVSGSPSLDDMLKYPSVIACFRKPVSFRQLKHFIKRSFFSSEATAEGLGKGSRLAAQGAEAAAAGSRI